MNFRKQLSIASLSLLLAFAATAQNRVSFGGIKSAWDFAYGINPAMPPLVVDVGFVGTGTQTLVVSRGTLPLSDGTSITPLATNAPVIVGVGPNAEVVTPSAVSCGTPQIYSSCSFTATFVNSHGIGDPITSATYGLAEAMNTAHLLGGLVAIDGRWASNGGTTTTVTTTKGWTNVTVLDWRGTSGATSYKATSNGANLAATTTVLY